MKEAINTTLEMFLCMIIGAALGACIVYSNMRDKGVNEEITNGSNVPDEFLVTENDIEKIRYEGKKRAEELIERMESNEKKENANLAIAEEKVKSGIPLNPEERDAYVRKIHLEEFHKVMDKH